MKLLRTPDECFAGLAGYDFAPHYTEVRDEDGTVIRIHHVDEGPRDAAPILLMHGNPTWAYLYRRFIPLRRPQVIPVRTGSTDIRPRRT